MIGRYNKWKLRSAWRRLLPIEWLIIGNQCRERERRLCTQHVHEGGVHEARSKGCIFRRSSSSDLYLSLSVYLSLYIQETISRSKSLGTLETQLPREFVGRSTFDRRRKRIVDHDRQAPSPRRKRFGKKKEGKKIRGTKSGGDARRRAINVTRN